MKILVYSKHSLISSFLTNQFSDEGYSTIFVRDVEQVECLSDLGISFMIVYMPQLVETNLNDIKILCSLIKSPVFLITDTSIDPNLTERAKKTGVDTIYRNPITQIFHKFKEYSFSELEEQEVVEIGSGISFNMNKRVIIREGIEIDLTRKENDILLYFLKHKNKVIDREELLEEFWGNIGSDTNVYVHVKKIREKLERDPVHPQYLVTKKGGGYIFNGNH
ncbi:response regulator transcription factor [Salipaludibacillus agaradhaerens]|uniref:winged helix-turn-helix transcriptional regulator n=1 Tax=Salipaludibacillus agaradhaerens TaxID=76935 RepID=UPI002151D633|nr:response regulator transcription factor [Salipaludibacillus agaradhaerens]MCR6107690.1 response regulator transcription factor [Salipaludibacillus agaradhaerens]MCR6119719.1 response regulator transcription factor [Salipaludibacillus agaradhaerens]UJW58727.1 response regulator transcription factor [Bacillus sp. A116_S68]